VSYGQVMQDER